MGKNVIVISDKYNGSGVCEASQAVPLASTMHLTLNNGITNLRVTVGRAKFISDCMELNYFEISNTRNLEVVLHLK